METIDRLVQRRRMALEAPPDLAGVLVPAAVTFRLDEVPDDVEAVWILCGVV
jgi:hypothetical protein